jgi:uncharacterized protein RhaS with RHS repeats
LIDVDCVICYYHDDPIGPPQELTKPNGEIAWSAAYDPLGRVEHILAGRISHPLCS